MQTPENDAPVACRDKACSAETREDCRYPSTEGGWPGYCVRSSLPSVIPPVVQSPENDAAPARNPERPCPWCGWVSRAAAPALCPACGGVTPPRETPA